MLLTALAPVPPEMFTTEDRRKAGMRWLAVGLVMMAGCGAAWGQGAASNAGSEFDALVRCQRAAAAFYVANSTESAEAIAAGVMQACAPRMAAWARFVDPAKAAEAQAAALQFIVGIVVQLRAARNSAASAAVGIIRVI